jgi:hypothetical protein
MAILLKAIYRFNAISIKKSNDIPHRKRKNLLKLTWKHKRLHIANAILSKKSHAGGITIPDFNYTTWS